MEATGPSRENKASEWYSGIGTPKKRGVERATERAIAQERQEADQKALGPQIPAMERGVRGMELQREAEMEETRMVAAEILSLLKTKHLTVSDAKVILRIVATDIEQTQLQ